MITLNYEPRTAGKTAEAIRKGGKIPAIFYGPKEKSTPIVVSYVDFLKVWKKAGESSVIVLKADPTATGHAGKTEDHECLIYAVDFHPVTDAPRHADFYVIEKGKKVKVHVPLVFKGVASAVKDKGGILVKVLREIEVEAAPKDLPHEIHVDIAALVEMNSTIAAKDLALPAGVTLITHGPEIVASISEAKEELEEVKPVDMSAIEVEKKGKEAKEGEAGAEAGDAKAGGAAKDAKDSKKEEKK